MTETVRIFLSASIFATVCISALTAMFLLSRGVAASEIGRERRGRWMAATGIVLGFLAIFAIPAIDLPWRDDLSATDLLRGALERVGAAVLFAPIWVRALRAWLHEERADRPLVTVSDMFAPRGLPFTLICVVVGGAMLAAAKFAPALS